MKTPPSSDDSLQVTVSADELLARVRGGQRDNVIWTPYGLFLHGAHGFSVIRGLSSREIVLRPLVRVTATSTTSGTKVQFALWPNPLAVAVGVVAGIVLLGILLLPDPQSEVPDWLAGHAAFVPWVVGGLQVALALAWRAALGPKELSEARDLVMRAVDSILADPDEGFRE